MSASRQRPFRAEKVKVDTSGKREWVLPEGITAWDLRSNRCRRLFHGVYVGSAVTLTPTLMAEAALLLVDPRSVASHHSAARIWGAVVPDDGLVHVGCVGPRPQVRGLKAHKTKPGQLGTEHKGVRLTTPAQTFVDLAAELSLVDLVVLGDSLVKKKRVTPLQLMAAAVAYRGRSRALARRAAALVRAGVDSPMETKLRLLIVLAGLPEPVVNHKICWEDGRVRWRFDLCYPDFKIVIEYDGRQHAESDEQWDTDRARREWMDGDEWRIVVAVSKDIYSTPAKTLSRVIAVMRAKPMRVPKLSEEWRQHFPSKPGDLAEPA